jgi:hypothetical protein
LLASIGFVITQAVRQWLLTAEARVQFQVTSCEIHGGRTGTKAGFISGFFIIIIFFFFITLLIIISPLLYTHLSPPSEMCDYPLQEAHYHIDGL